jgi:hypothetical protein
MVSPALQYMMLLPYMDSTMFGEGYQPGYDRAAGTMDPIDGGGPDWWLIKVSALPFGLMNDMLGNGQRWRGWLFGCVTRLPYGGAKTNKADWAIWDRYKLTEATMVGWWEKQDPRLVQVVAPAGADDAMAVACTTTAGHTGHILATAYMLKGAHTLVSVASWANNNVSCDLLVDWSSLGLSPSTKLQAHAIDGFQSNATFTVQGNRVANLPTAPARGRLLVLGTYIALLPGLLCSPLFPGPLLQGLRRPHRGVQASRLRGETSQRERQAVARRVAAVPVRASSTSPSALSLWLASALSWSTRWRASVARGRNALAQFAGLATKAIALREARWMVKKRMMRGAIARSPANKQGTARVCFRQQCSRELFSSSLHVSSGRTAVLINKYE